MTPSWNPEGQARPAGPAGPVSPFGPGGPAGPCGPGPPFVTLTVAVVVACVGPDRAVAAKYPDPPASSRLATAINVFLTDLDPLLQGGNALLAVLLGAFALRPPVPGHRDRRAHG